MKKILTILLCVGLLMGSYGCGQQKSSDETAGNTTDTSGYPEKSTDEVNDLLKDEYNRVVDPYFDNQKKSGAFSFELYPHRYIVTISNNEVSKVEMRRMNETGEKVAIYSSEDDFDIDTENAIVTEFIDFLGKNSLNYADFIKWVTAKYNENTKTEIDTLSYNLKTKSEKQVYNILKKYGYKINDVTYSTGIDMEASSRTLYFEGKHYDTTNPGDIPFVDLKLKDKVDERLYNTTLAYHIYYDSDCHYLSASIVYEGNVQLLDITPNAKNIAGDFVDDDTNYISKSDMKIMKNLHEDIEAELKRMGLSMADVAFFMMRHYGDYKN